MEPALDRMVQVAWPEAVGELLEPFRIGALDERVSCLAERDAFALEFVKARRSERQQRAADSGGGPAGWVPWLLWRMDEMWETFGPDADYALLGARQLQFRGPATEEILRFGRASHERRSSSQ